ncbi:hypothetical protein APA_2902 [Pseudanabaena sp. lw0831]|nr:hypothetical protein APA_2902 [Pseudanabaena sp. lw0831]
MFCLDGVSLYIDVTRNILKAGDRYKVKQCANCCRGKNNG